MAITIKQQRRDELARIALTGEKSDEQLVQLMEDLEVQEVIEEARTRDRLEVYSEHHDSAVDAGDKLIEACRKNPPDPDSPAGRLVFYTSQSIQRVILAYRQILNEGYKKLFEPNPDCRFCRKEGRA
jgi:hypothetical protein